MTFDSTVLATVKADEFHNLIAAEVERAVAKLSEQLAQDTWGPRKYVKIFSMGALGNEATWVGTCTLCGARHLTNLDPTKHLTMPGPCDEEPSILAQSVSGSGNILSCHGNVLLDKDSDALLAAYLVGGWEAIRPLRITLHGKVTVL